MKSLVLGGARSGKSHYAQQLVSESQQRVIYIATAHPGDAEMMARIERHKHDRPSHWVIVEEEIALADVIQRHDASDTYILVDCLTLWLTNLLSENDGALLQSEIDKLLSVLSDLKGNIVFVSNEVGQGIMPMGELSRRFVDEAGRLHQVLAKLSDQVVLLVAGLPQKLK